MAGRPAAAWLDPVVARAGGGTATVTAVVGPHHVNLLGVCHGGVVFTLAERAAAAAVGDHDGPVVSTGSTIELLGPARLGATLRAETRRVHARGSTAVCDTTVTADGVVVALVRTRLRRRPPVA